MKTLNANNVGYFFSLARVSVCVFCFWGGSAAVGNRCRQDCNDNSSESRVNAL